MSDHRRSPVEEVCFWLHKMPKDWIKPSIDLHFKLQIPLNKLNGEGQEEKPHCEYWFGLSSLFSSTISTHLKEAIGPAFLLKKIVIQ